MSRARINKALDFNKLMEDQRKGKLLKKRLSYPMAVSYKYDGNYVVVRVEGTNVTFTTSGGLNYTHLDEHPFDGVMDGAYLAERIYGEGKLGDRNKCNLRGAKDAQTSVGHSYKVFDYITLEDYDKGFSTKTFVNRYTQLCNSNLDHQYIAKMEYVTCKADLDIKLVKAVALGYEGVMAIQIDQIWTDTQSRTVNLIKYKKRRTADLMCIGYNDGTGKYEGMIGSLKLTDSEGRTVDVGSGLSDAQRSKDPSVFAGKIIEIEYEQIVDTYIQPTILRVREDKNVSD